MGFVLKKCNFKKYEDRRWLFECGQCKSDFLFSYKDLHTISPTEENNYISGDYVICPVCGAPSHKLAEDWLSEGYIRGAKLIEPAYIRKVMITNYDFVETTYSLESDSEVYKLADYIPGFEFPVKEDPYEE